MSELIKRIQCHPKFPMIAAAATYSLLTVVSFACLLLYFTKLVEHDFMHWQLIGFTLVVLNGISGYSEFVDEDSFCPLRDLLDYCAVVLVLPCYAAEMWIKTELGPPQLSAVLAGLGFMAAIMYVVLEYRRQDLTDLAIFANALCLFVVGIMSKNPLTVLATSIFVAGYVIYKRTEEQCCLAPQDKFNLVLAVFVIIALCSFDQSLTDPIKEKLSGIAGMVSSSSDE